MNDTVRLGSVDYHRHLLTSDDKFAIIKGGGMVEFEYNDEDKTVRFAGGSADYGTFKQFDIKKSIKNTQDLFHSLDMLGKLVCGNDFDISNCKIFIREEEINL